MSQPRGERFSDVQVRNRSTGAWSAVNPAHCYTVVTNDFIASRRDGCTTFGTVFAAGNHVNNHRLYTRTFVDHVLPLGSVRRPAAADCSHQAVTKTAGFVLP